MSNKNFHSSVEHTFQLALDECLQSIQASFASYGQKKIVTGNDKLPQAAPPPLPRFEDPFSPSSDEGGSVTFGSPLLMNEERNHHSLGVELFSPLHTSTATHGENIVNKNTAVKTENTVTTGENTRNTTSTEPLTDNNNHKKPETTRSYALPEITFSSSILTSRTQKIEISIPEMITEGLKVEKFLNEFKYHIQLSKLNIETHWHGLLGICFQNVKEKNMDLYLWFKKHVDEGLTWYTAQELIKRQLGFYSADSKLKIKEALSLYRKGPLESFEEYYNRFHSYVEACELLSLYKDEVLIHHFIKSLGSINNVYNFLNECLYKQFLVKKKYKTLPLPENNYIIVSSTTTSNDDDYKLSVLSKVFYSWNEFETNVLNVHFKKLCTMDSKSTKSKRQITFGSIKKRVSHNQDYYPSRRTDKKKKVSFA